MKKKTFLLFFAGLFGLTQAIAGNVLTVNDVTLPQGGQATLEIGCEFDTEYTAFELQLALPDGLSLLCDDEGYPIIEKTFDTNHIMTGNLLPSNGNYKITCRSMDNISMPTSGPLLRVTLLADASIALGTNLTATVTGCEFTRTADSNGENLADVSFGIHITEFRTILDENSTTMPVTEAAANVRMKRTIKANEWSTICLPFAMTEAQVKAAFGDDVELADFASWTPEEDDEGAIVSITVGFTDVTEIEANHPYIIKVSSAISEFTVDGVDIDPEEEPVVQVGRKSSERGWMYGTYIVTKVPEENLFLSENKFWYSTGNTTTKAFRGYFMFRDVLDAYYDETSAPIYISIGGETTRLDQLNIDGEDSNYYDLNGRVVKTPQKGVYIRNGKTVIVK